MSSLLVIIIIILTVYVFKFSAHWRKAVAIIVIRAGAGELGVGN